MNFSDMLWFKSVNLSSHKNAMINYIFYDLFNFHVVGTSFVLLRPEKITNIAVAVKK